MKVGVGVSYCCFLGGGGGPRLEAPAGPSGEVSLRRPCLEFWRAARHWIH